MKSNREIKVEIVEEEIFSLAIYHAGGYTAENVATSLTMGEMAYVHVKANNFNKLPIGTMWAVQNCTVRIIRDDSYGMPLHDS